MPLLRGELGLSLVQAGWVSAMLCTLAVVAALGFGLLAGRLGALRMVMGGLGVSALAWLATLGVQAGPLSAGAAWPGGFALLMASRFF